MKNIRLPKSKLYRQWAVGLSLLIILSLMLPFTRALAVAGQVDANNVTSAPSIDGNLNESGWNLTTSASKTTIGTPNNTVTFGAMWDASNLYIAVKVLDGNLFNDSANTWEDDSVEVYIDANNNAGSTYDSFDRQFVKGYNDTSLSGIGSQTGVQHAWAAVAGGYSTEMAIPWSNLGVSPTSGLTIGFDVGYNDDDNAGTRDSQAIWWGTLNNYNNTSAFGKLVLMGGTAPTATWTTAPTKTFTPNGPTIFPTATRTNSPVPTATITTGQSAYPSGVAWAVPGTIQAENYDLGGETVAYHDSDAANTGGQYRPSDGVDIEATSDTGGGYNVGWTAANEWLEYTVNVATAGNYTLTERVASAASTGSFRVEFNGVDKTGTITTPNTGGWQTYQTLTQTVSLSAGVQIMRVYFLGNDTNLNYFTLTAVGGTTNTPTITPAPSRSSTPTATVTTGQSAYPAGVAWAVPGTIQAENFDLGGETVAYHDNEILNQGGQYRTSDGVDIEATGDTGGGYNVGWTLANEWLEYTINVPNAGNYTLTERVASTATASSFRVEFNGIDKTGTVVVPNTGGWQTWQSISQTVNLSAGVQVMRLYIVTDGFNLNYISLNPASGATATQTRTNTPTPTATSGSDCWPAWVSTTAYTTGAQVSRSGRNYQANYWTQGNDPDTNGGPVGTGQPWIPMAFCGGINATATPGGTGFASIVSNAQFDQMFPSRNAFYTYQGLVTAANFYPAFAGTGSLDTKKREAAAALANFNHETGGLWYITEVNKNVYCEPSNTQFPCAAGKQYYGRGPIQISWNFNYGLAGTALGLPLLSNPDLVEQDASIAWKTALWYWMTQKGPGTMTPHDAMVNGAGFGETIRSINGSLECNGGNTAQVQSRINAYNNFIGILGTTAGPGNISC